MNIKSILIGQNIPTFKVFDYSTKEGKKLLEELKKDKEEITKMKKVNWTNLNKFK
jgi:hypothetical protein